MKYRSRRAQTSRNARPHTNLGCIQSLNEIRHHPVGSRFDAFLQLKLMARGFQQLIGYGDGAAEQARPPFTVRLADVDGARAAWG